MKPDTIILTQQSFDKLFRLYQRKLYAVAYSLVHDANTAEDIVHDSFMTIWENRETVQFTSIEAYLFGVVKKRCLKYRRDRYTGKAVYEKILMKERGVMGIFIPARSKVAIRTNYSSGKSSRYAANNWNKCRN